MIARVNIGLAIFYCGCNQSNPSTYDTKVRNIFIRFYLQDYFSFFIKRSRA